jgi:hypothetical protein
MAPTFLFAAAPLVFAAVFAEYYGLPMLSLRSCCYHKIAANAEGFKWRTPGMENTGRGWTESLDSFDDGTLYLDRVHPNGFTGHRCGLRV